MRNLKEALENAANKVQTLNTGSKHFSEMSGLAHDFVRAHTKGDINTLRQILSSDIDVVDEEGIIVGVYDYEGTEVRDKLYDGTRHSKYIDMCLRTYIYNEFTDIYYMNIVEYYELEYEAGIFLNLGIKKLNGEWKVVEFSFDI